MSSQPLTLLQGTTTLPEQGPSVQGATPALESVRVDSRRSENPVKSKVH